MGPTHAVLTEVSGWIGRNFKWSPLWQEWGKPLIFQLLTTNSCAEWNLGGYPPGFSPTTVCAYG